MLIFLYSLKEGDYMKNPETARRLLEALRNSDITQRELSERAEVKESSVSHYVNGSHVPSTISAGKMARVLNVAPLWLMGYDVPMERTAPASSSARTLLPDEAQLLDKYQQLNSDGKQKAIEYLDLLGKDENNKKDTESSSGRNIS